MTFEVLLGDLKHIAVCFSLPNPNSEFHWSLFIVLFFFLFALQYHQILLPRADSTYHFPDPPLWSKFFCLWLTNVFVCYLSSGSCYWFSNLRTVWQDSCSKFHACSLKLHCIWKCAALYSKETLFHLFLKKRTALGKVTGNLTTGVLSRDLSGGAGRGGDVWRRKSESSAEYIGKHFKDQNTMRN